jgi:hypothetical protein
MSAELSKYVSEKVLEIIAQEKVSVALLSYCGSGCGALVRLVGSNKERCWFCPLCGAGMPYAFWSVKSEKDEKGCSKPERKVSVDELIEKLGPNACAKCGESPRCRCYRVALHDAQAQLQADLLNDVDPLHTPKAVCEHCLQVFVWRVVKRDLYDPYQAGRKMAMCISCQEAIFGVPQPPKPPPPPEPPEPDFKKNILI